MENINSNFIEVEGSTWFCDYIDKILFNVNHIKLIGPYNSPDDKTGCNTYLVVDDNTFKVKETYEEIKQKLLEQSLNPYTVFERGDTGPFTVVTVPLKNGYISKEIIDKIKNDKINMNTITNECPICGKCSMSASNQYCPEHKHLGENTLAKKLDNFIIEPIKPYTKEAAYECLQKLGILDEVGEITPAFQDIIIRTDCDAVATN